MKGAAEQNETEEECSGAIALETCEPVEIRRTLLQIVEPPLPFSTQSPLNPSTSPNPTPPIPPPNIQGGGLYKLEFLHFKFCTKILYAICSVFLRICAGNNSKRPLFLMSNYWEPYIICSLTFKKWHRFCRARIYRFIFSPTRNIPPPQYLAGALYAPLPPLREQATFGTMSYSALYKYLPIVRTTFGVDSVKFWDFSVVLAKGGYVPKALADLLLLRIHG